MIWKKNYGIRAASQSQQCKSKCIILHSQPLTLRLLIDGPIEYNQQLITIGLDWTTRIVSFHLDAIVFGLGPKPATIRPHPFAALLKAIVSRPFSLQIFKSRLPFFLFARGKKKKKNRKKNFSQEQLLFFHFIFLAIFLRVCRK